MKILFLFGLLLIFLFYIVLPVSILGLLIYFKVKYGLGPLALLKIAVRKWLRFLKNL